ncbi:MAG TPA: glycoside hydrolase family 88 protein [Bacteroidota bacterium]|nr:glycoside hydrolase family 88 protein [Bacteroidota bacterium]
MMLFFIASSGNGLARQAEGAGWSPAMVSLQVSPPVFPALRCNIRDFGAVEGGATKCTDAIRQAIQRVTTSGGGHVIVPAGRWLTGAIRLRSHTDLHLERGAVLIFSQDPADYLPAVFSRHEDTECYKFSAFVYADSATDIAVTGEGVLEGQGKPWWAWKTLHADCESTLVAMGNAGVPVGQRVFDGTHGRFLRPAFFQPMQCRNVLVEGVTFRYGAFWTITPTYCENVIVRRVNVETAGSYGHAPNGDGVDPSSSKNVLIEDCNFSTGDDCIALKAGRDVDGRRVHKATENIVIRRCTGRQGHGGIVIGSETAGGIHDVSASDCRFTGTDRMVRIKTQRGRGGILERMWFDNIAGDSIRMEAVHVNMLYTGSRLPAHSVDSTTPIVRDLYFANIRQRSGDGYALEILGIPEMPAQGIECDSLAMSSAKGVHIEDASAISLANSTISPSGGPVIRIGHSRGITLDNVGTEKASAPFLCVDGDDVQDVWIHRAGGEGHAAVLPRTDPWSSRIAGSFLARHPEGVTYDSNFTQKSWNYEQGLMLVALDRMWRHTGDERYFRFVKDNIDRFVGDDGSIATYNRSDFNLDNIGPGRALLALYAATHQEKYRRAADTLRRQLREQPRTHEGGFWHKKIYPNQMWLDGLFMAEPFYASYAVMFGDTSAFSDIIRQFTLITAHTRDSVTGLLYHGYDESHAQPWADKSTGRSPCFWARAIGWYAMALVDVLDILPERQSGRAALLAMLRDVAKAVANTQDPESGLWYQVIDQRGREGNYQEASASAMFTYVFARGAARGYLDSTYARRARKAFDGIVTRLVTVEPDGFLDLLHTCRGAGLGGNPYRDGTYAYYISEPQRTNDLKGLGPFLLAAIELEREEGLK